jgi:hypothetical protein
MVERGIIESINDFWHEIRETKNDCIVWRLNVKDIYKSKNEEIQAMQDRLGELKGEIDE